MSPRDFAVVIGIDEYDDLDKLTGARNDAQEFVRWLQQPHSSASIHAHDLLVKIDNPDCSELRKAIAAVWKKVKAAGARRLYIFYAGHGFGTNLSDAGVYMSDYTEDFDGACCDLIATANSLRFSGHFQEIVLFMDCCRVFDNRSTPEHIGPKVKSGQPAAHFYCLACGLGDRSHETSVEGKFRGIFSVSLMDALDGKIGAALDVQGNVTAHSLKRFLSALPKTHCDPPNEPWLKNLVLASGFVAPSGTSFHVELNEPHKGFGLYSGDPFGPLHWKRATNGNGFQVYREDEDLAVIVTVPATAPFERRAAVFPGETSVTI